MSINIRFPNITATTDSGKLQQLLSYMHQLAEQLNWALETMENDRSGSTASAVSAGQKETTSPKEAEDTFNSIKALIIKSADIVKAYEQTIKTNFNSTYFADSDFGTYIEETTASISQNSKGINETYTNLQKITNAAGTGSLDQLAQQERITRAYIRRGELDCDENGNVIYGVEVGQTSESGQFLRYARFTAERLTFFDSQGNAVAYIGAGDDDKNDTNCLYVAGKAVFLSNIQLGRYKTDTSDGLAFTWIGG